MLKPIDPGAARRPQAEPLPPEAVNHVFKVLHGFYGNLFLSKFATGHADEAGDDQGITSARQVWGHGLRDFDIPTIKAALLQCLKAHPEFPPSLPQFVGLCAANRVTETYKFPAIGISAELSGRYAREAREALARAREKLVHKETGYLPLPKSLDGLKQAIARAVAEAGGDEAAELHRLDLMLAPRGATA
jgi:hypothetical protein